MNNHSDRITYLCCLIIGGGKVTPTANEKEENYVMEELQRYRIQNLNLNKKLEQLTEIVEKKKKEIMNLRKTNNMQRALSSSHQRNHNNEPIDMELEIKPGKNPSQLGGTRVPQTPAIRAAPTTPSPQAIPDINMIEIAKKYKSR